MGEKPKPRERTWADIGVRPNELRLNPQVIKAIRENKTTKIETELAISADFVPQHITDTCFDQYESFQGVAPDRIRKAFQFNMPNKESHLTGLTICVAGKSTGRIKFQHENEWFLIPRPREDPDKFEAPLKEHALGKTNVNCTFLWGPSGFSISIRPITNTAAITPQCAVPMSDDSPPPPPLLVGNASKPEEIPVSKHGQEITQARFKLFRNTPHCVLSVRGSNRMFRVPNSLSKRLCLIAMKRSADKTLDPAAFSLDFLVGCKLVKTDNVMIRVQGQGNRESRMWIVEASDKVLVPQLPSKPRKEHKRPSI
jgi:hypothetical protein